MEQSTQQVTINNISYSPKELENDIWLRLLNGSLRAKESFHLSVIATVNNGLPEQRTVVLRKAIPEKKQLWFHTDLRSNKIPQIVENSYVHWLFYDKQTQIQLRVQTLARIHQLDELAATQWQNTHSQSRKCYLTELPPGSSIEFPGDGLEYLGNKTENEWGKSNFAVIVAQVQQIDWLWLNHQGHRRAVINYENGTVKDFSWVVP
jgi:3-hydroxyisobutyrate dehydrogenase